MESAEKKNNHGIFPRCSDLSLPVSPRNRMITQKNKPTISKLCQKRPRSRYSNPWAPNHDQPRWIQPCTPAYSPARLPKTTSAHAPNSEYDSQFCRRGSLPVIMGARKIPAAKNDVETQKMASCKCHIRAMLKGRTRARSKPKKFAISAR